MIKIKTDFGDTAIQISGSVPIICTDTVQIVRAIYNDIKETDEKAAETYKKMMCKNLCDLAFTDKVPEIPGFEDVIESLEKLVKMIGNKA